MAQFSVHFHLTCNQKLKYHYYFDPVHGGVGVGDVSVPAGEGDKPVPGAG